MHSVTDRRTDRQTDNIIMPIADHSACSNDQLKNADTGVLLNYPGIFIFRFKCKASH